LTLKVQETRVTIKGDKLSDKLASFIKLPPLIPTKMPKKVKKFPSFSRKTTNRMRRRI